MAEDSGEDGGEPAVAPKGNVAVAEGGADDLDADFVGARRRHHHLLNSERLAAGSAHRRCECCSLYC